MQPVPVPVRPRPRRLALVPVEVVDVGVGVGRDHRRLDVLRRAGALPGVQAQQQAHGVDHGRVVIGGAVVGPLQFLRNGGDLVDGHGLIRRRESVTPHLRHAAAGYRAGDGRHGRPMRVGPGGAVPAGVEVHQVRIDLLQLLVSDARPFGRARPHAVQQQIRPGRQLAHDLLAFLGLEVKTDALGSRHGPVRREGQPLPSPVAARCLDADHPRAQFGHQRAAQRSVDHRRQVQQRYPIQRALGHRLPGAIGSTPVAATQPRQHFLGVLTQKRSRSRRAARRLFHAHHGTKLPGVAHCRDVDTLRVAVVHDLRMLQRPLRRVVGLGGHVAGLAQEYVHPLVQRLLLDLFQHDPFQRGHGILVQPGRRLEPRVLVDEVHVQPVHHRPEQPLHHVAQLDPLAVLRARGQVARGIGPPDAHPGVRRVFVGPVLHHLPVDPGHVVIGGHGLQHAGLHTLAPACLLPHVQGGRDAAQQGRGGGVANALHHHVVGALARILLGEHHHPTALGGDHSRRIPCSWRTDRGSRSWSAWHTPARDGSSRRVS